MYKKHIGAGAGGAGGLAATGAPHIALFLAVAATLLVIGLCLYRSSVVLGRRTR